MVLVLAEITWADIDAEVGVQWASMVSVDVAWTSMNVPVIHVHLANSA